MTIWCVGSINVDHVYTVPRIPAPGETLSATGMRSGLGGKGANQSVAAARAGAEVRHIGCVGADGSWARQRLTDYGVDTRHVATVDAPTGHAIINVAEDGENAIVILCGANATLSPDRIAAALDRAAPGDLLLLQNETNAQAEAARLASYRRLRVIYSAAPFDPVAVRRVVGSVSLLVVNEGEAAELAASIGDVSCDMVVTRGAAGAEFRSGGSVVSVPAFPAEAVDTTGAGDTFLGYLAAALDHGLEIGEAMRHGAAAAAIMVARSGTADVIPSRNEVAGLLRG